MMVVNTTTLSNGRFDRDWRISNDCECIPFFPQPNPGVYTSAPRAWTPAAAAPTQRKSILRRMTLKTRQTRNTRHSLYIGDLRLLTKLKHIDHQKKFQKKVIAPGIFWFSFSSSKKVCRPKLDEAPNTNQEQIESYFLDIYNYLIRFMFFLFLTHKKENKTMERETIQRRLICRCTLQHIKILKSEGKIPSLSLSHL